MSAKLLYSLKDENPDLQKQIGCMHGIFQLFDRQHFLAGRRTNHHNNKRLPPAQSDSHGEDLNNALQKAKDENLKKIAKEKQIISTELSRTSFSSSCSSSLSSLHCNKAAHLETSSISQTIFSKTPSRDLTMNQSDASLQLSHRSLDLKNAIKDSMYREACALSIETATKEEAMDQGVKYIESPRPMQPPTSVGLNESFRDLGRRQDAPWNSNKEKDLTLKDARFSYEGRESRGTSKSTIKLKELPRLSLDSKAGSIRGSTSEIKSNNLSGDLQRGYGKSKKILKAQQELGSYKRPSSIVAKLMGLEAFPDSMSINESPSRLIKTCPDEGLNAFSRLSRTNEKNENRISGSPRTSQPSSPKLKNADSVNKPTPSSRFPIEPAPWRQPDGSRASQIRLETQKTYRSAKFVAKTGNNSNVSLKLENLRNLLGNSQHSDTTKGTNSPERIKSPIVMMKTANFIEKASNPTSAFSTDRLAVLCKVQIGDSAQSRKESVEMRTNKNRLKDPSVPLLRSMDKNSRTKTLRSTKTPKVPECISRENTTSSSRGCGTVSPILQQKKLGLEMQSRPTTLSSDFSKTIRQSSRQPTESSSQGRQLRPQYPNLQQSHNQKNEVNSKMRDLSYQSDAVSQQSERKISLASHCDTQITSSDRPSIYGTFFKQDNHKQKSPAATLSEDRVMETPAISPSEQASPISVLDATFYNDDSPSPQKLKYEHFPLAVLYPFCMARA